MNLARKVLIALVSGVVIGLLMNIFAKDTFTVLNNYLFDPAGDLFIKLLKMLIVPVVFFSLVLGVTGVGDLKKMGRMGLKTVIYFLTTTLIALVIAVSLAYLFKPGVGVSIDVGSNDFEPDEAPSIVETLLNIIPTNPFEAMSEGNMLQIIFFSILFGIGIVALKDKTETLKSFMEQGNDVIMYLVKLVIYLMPYGAFVLIVSAIGEQGLDAIGAMMMYMLVVFLALIIQAVLVYGSSVFFLGKLNPMKFFKGFFPAMITGFSTSSSTATLPVSMENAQKNLNVKRSISSFVQPLGATVNMDGTAIFQAVATVFIAQVYSVELSFSQIIIIILTALLASIGTVGVPGSGLIILALVLESVGLPVSGIAMIIGVDRILDMFRTAINVSGDASCAVYISQSERRIAQRHQQNPPE